MLIVFRMGEAVSPLRSPSKRLLFHHLLEVAKRLVLFFGSESDIVIIFQTMTILPVSSVWITFQALTSVFREKQSFSLTEQITQEFQSALCSGNTHWGHM